MFEIGKLYTCQEYYLLIYPNISAATTAADIYAAVVADIYAAGAAAADIYASYWSKKLNCKVTFSDPQDIFMIVDQKEIDSQQYIKILARDKLGGEGYPFLGWIVWKDWIKLQKVKSNV